MIITPSGNVKIVGLLIEAALRPSATEAVPGANTPELVDVTDLGRLLYASLVCRWPGGQAFGLPSAPTMGRRWMTPRRCVPEFHRLWTMSAIRFSAIRPDIMRPPSSTRAES